MKLKWEVKDARGAPSTAYPPKERVYCLDEETNNLIVAQITPREEGAYHLYDLAIFEDGTWKGFEFLDATDAKKFCENYFNKKAAKI